MHRIGVVDMIKIVYIVTLTLVLALVGLIGIDAQQAYATSESLAYMSGYKHGVSDSRIERMNPTSHSLYIVQPGKNLYDHTQNFTWGYMDGYCSLQSCSSKKSVLDPNSFNAGLRYGDYDWDQHSGGDHSFACPLARAYWHSNFCNGYDAALAYQNSDY